MAPLALALAVAVAVVLAVGEPGGSDDDTDMAGLRDGGGDRAGEASGKGAAGRPIRITISVSGDILIHSPLYRRALQLGGGRAYDFRPMLRPIRRFVAGPDLAVCHLETTLTRGEPRGYPRLATPASIANAIAATGWDACSTASNHSLDQGLEGIRETSRALDRAGVAHTGTAATAARSRRPLTMKANGARVALLAYTTATNGIPVPAAWAVNLASPRRILRDARRARSRGADAVLVNLHWGDENSPRPNASQIELARTLTRASAVTAVVGQGPHVVQPIPRVNGTRVVFSEGNLLSNQTPGCCAAGSQDGLIALLDLAIGERRAWLSRVRYVPIWVRHPDYEVLPIGRALRAGAADPAALRASYRRTVEVAGRARRLEPVPGRLP